ncbi:DEAD/DEAH box helicase [Anaerovibrio lipolyticus]|uniref:DEAD/DEAH box helicase n=1 Tax=Anaerovibrio lipolyticus TaxID=82374 RepID=UPI000486E328|nr:DEAD/DEAH box helicase family protein [Anaerovibrio lipolyticus]
MIVELISFQNLAVRDLRQKVHGAIAAYKDLGRPQIISLQAPTGAGKTIMMAAFIEKVLFGDEDYPEQPDAVFVWLSDSPSLNQQSMDKIDSKSDKIRVGQCITIEESSFDKELLEDGYIYFLNTQKIGKSGNLTKHSDSRQYTIWETLANTAREKSDRLYFIIDEAHRGMQGKEAGKATSIMQKFIKGSPADGLQPMPLVIGMSATAKRFDKLVENTTDSVSHFVRVTPDAVRASGLLKDKIIAACPKEAGQKNDLAMLQAATEDWMEKCAHWRNYTITYHYKHFNPVFVIQVCAGKGDAISDNNLDDILAKIEEHSNIHFEQGEVVHAFGDHADITINGLKVSHVNPQDIADANIIRVVFFKESLSTGWDCPRAETMISFRNAQDATYIAQLIGRMVRTPMQCRVQYDELLNSVSMFLPYYNSSTVDSIITELQNTEGGEIPTYIETEEVSGHRNGGLTVHTPTRQKAVPNHNDGMQSLFDNDGQENNVPQPVTNINHPENAGSYDDANVDAKKTLSESKAELINNNHDTNISVGGNVDVSNRNNNTNSNTAINSPEEIPLEFELDRAAILKFINETALLKYNISTVAVNDYKKSLFELASLLTQKEIFVGLQDIIMDEITGFISNFVESLKNRGKYKELAKKYLEFQMSLREYDVLQENGITGVSKDLSLFTVDTDMERRLRIAETKLGNFGICNAYLGRFDKGGYSQGIIDCIMYSEDVDCQKELAQYSKSKFYELTDKYRRKIGINPDESIRQAYDRIMSNSSMVSKHTFILPEFLGERGDVDGKEYYYHLYADRDTGIAKIKLKSWEEGVIKEEAERKDFVCWLRNRSRASWAMCIPYDMDNVTKPMYPDFIIVRRDKDTDYVIDILEPHGDYLADNLPKAKGLAKYVENETRVGRVQLIREMSRNGVKGFYRLDLAIRSIRDKVLSAANNEELNHIFECDAVLETE